MESNKQQKYNTFKALELTTQGKKMRCSSFGRNCGFILEYDGKGFHFVNQLGYINTSELDYKAEWVED